jgi:hypothetical protein
MKVFHIYALVNSRTLDAYVGYSWQPPGQRLSKHLKALMEGSHHCSRLQEAWNRYGPECFQFTVLVELGNVSRDFAKAVEGVMIGKFGTYNEMIDNKWSDAMRKKRGEHSNLMWSNPERRAEHARLVKMAWADPERRQNYANRRTRWVDPDQAIKHSEHMKALWADPERRQRLEARRAARWADPEAKARQGEKMRAYHAARRATLQDV